MRFFTLLSLMVVASGAAVGPLRAGELTPVQRAFLEDHCTDCHDGETRKGGLDLTALKPDFADAKTFEQWVKIHDRIRLGEMPPAKRERPPEAAKGAFLQPLADALTAADRAQAEVAGRTLVRRLNRHEYENTLREVLGAPWLQLKEMLPEDGEAHRFNKVSEALDVSHVQMARYLDAADHALRAVVAKTVEAPPVVKQRHYARDQSYLARKMVYNEFNRSPERATFPMLGTEPQPEVVDGKAPVTVGEKDPAKREKEAFGVVASSYEPIEPRFNEWKVPIAGHYKLRFMAHTFWAGPESEQKWWKPDRKKISPGRRDEPVVIAAEMPPRQLRRLGAFDVQPEAAVQELEVDLLAGEIIRFDAARLFRSRPPGTWRNPLAERDGQPGVAFRWMETEGPLVTEWPPAGHQLLFGDLPLRTKSGGVEVLPRDARADARRLLHGFMQRVCRRPVREQDAKRFQAVIDQALEQGTPFMDAMIAGYTAVLCSPAFLYLEEKPGPLDDYALASRLAYFLWNSEPDAALRSLAAAGKLREGETLRRQTERLLGDARAERFIHAFLAYWLDLRKHDATTPDATLYPDYYLDDLLVESAIEETQRFFSELLAHDLPARHLITSDFTFLNERLALHYGLPPVQGVALRKVPLPADSLRGGLLTMASVLKVTANGTTTSPVLRGAWVMERIVGRKPPPPPPSVPAVEPDTRGATTIREQLEKHRAEESCAACHKVMDPPGFALESFDVLGGWRKAYRALSPGKRVEGFGKNGQPFEFHYGPAVDASGELADGRRFADIREFKALLAADERQIARNLVTQLAIFATGSAPRFADRPEIEQVLERASSAHYGVRSLIHALVQSRLFREK